MLTGTVAGGVIAQYTNLGVPYVMRIAALAVTFVLAFFMMHDEGFRAKKGVSLRDEIGDVVAGSVEFGYRSAPIRWMMLAGLFSGGVGIFGFYAMQPYLLELYGDPNSYAVAGVSASIVAGAQIVGGLLVPHASRLFHRRTSLLIAGVILSSAALLAIGLVRNFWLVLIFLAIWAVAWSAAMPVRQAYVNGIVPSEQRATVLSADNLLGSLGGVISQPGLGRVAEVWGYPASYIATSSVQFLAMPFIALAKGAKAKSDDLKSDESVDPNFHTT
jgi:MFS family permease